MNNATKPSIHVEALDSCRAINIQDIKLRGVFQKTILHVPTICNAMM